MRRLGLLAVVLVVLSLAAPVQAAVASVTYQAHVQRIGWQAPVSDGATAGTTGQSLRAEAMKVSGINLTYRAHVQSIGWMGWVQEGQVAGTTGRALRLEAFQIRSEDPAYSIEYRAHVQSIGWQGWVRDGATAGTTGRALRVEAFQIRLVAPVLRLAFTSDNGMSSAAQAVFATIGSSAPAATSILGDFAHEPNAEDEFCAMVNTRVAGKVAIVAGNHQGVDTGDGTIENYVACLPDEVGAVGAYGRDYYFDVGNVRVILISPDIPLLTGTMTYLPGTPEREWLKSVTRAGKAAGLWTVLGMHHPCFSLGLHDCADTTPAVSDLAIGLGMDVVMTGHDHNYMRTHQIRGTKASPVVIDRDNDYVRQSETSKGTVFVGVGNGGHTPRAVSPLTSIWKVANGTNSPGGFAYGYGEMTASATTLSWRHVSVTGATLADTFVVRR